MKLPLKKLVTLSFLYIITFFSSCTNPNSTGPSDLPNMALPSIYIDIPSCIKAAENSSEITLSKSFANSDITLLDFYKPIPYFIKLADSAQLFTQSFINELEKTDIPINSTFTHNGNKITTYYNDDTLSQKFSSIVITDPNVSEMKFNYFTNSLNKIKSILTYKIVTTGDLVEIGYDNQTDKKTKVSITVHSGKKIDELTIDEPKTIKVKLTKEDSLIKVTGIAYTPKNTITLGDYNPELYLFKANVHEKNNVASMSIALTPKDAKKEEYFKRYSLDVIIIDYYLAEIKKSLANDENFIKAIKWSIENNDTIPINDAKNIKWTEIVKTDTSGFLNSFNTDDLIKFTKYNIGWMNTKKEFTTLLNVIKTKQPIYYKANAQIYGTGFDVKPKGLENLSNDSIEPIDISEIITFQ